MWIETFSGKVDIDANMVTPCTGVWIETVQIRRQSDDVMSLLVQECGLKQNFAQLHADRERVTPCTGVWIETLLILHRTQRCVVTPCTGVWIETNKNIISNFGSNRHSLYRSVD